MTRSGITRPTAAPREESVLIPLLVDDPLWAIRQSSKKCTNFLVLIPLLVDDPLWEDGIRTTGLVPSVLIPLLVDDPLWAYNLLSWK